MVCRDANTHRAREVNPLVISTPQERALHRMGEREYAPYNYWSHLSNVSSDETTASIISSSLFVTCPSELIRGGGSALLFPPVWPG